MAATRSGLVGLWRRRREAVSETWPPEALDAVLGFVLAFLVAMALGLAPVALVGLVGLAVLAWCLVGWVPAAAGLSRSLFEIVVPVLLAWTAIAAGGALAAPEAVRVGVVGELTAWVASHWLVPTLAVAFGLGFHGASRVRQGDAPGLARALAWGGYLLAIGALVLADRGLGAVAVTLLWVVQWPYQALWRAGRPAWHWRATEPLGMAAMLAAFGAAGWL